MRTASLWMPQTRAMQSGVRMSATAPS
jgi:hypothetical protein